MTETKQFVDAYQDTIAALRAELDAAKAANAALKAERDEARRLVRKIYDAETLAEEGEFFDQCDVDVPKWDAERPAPDTNRDAGDESGG